MGFPSSGWFKSGNWTKDLGVALLMLLTSILALFFIIDFKQHPFTPLSVFSPEMPCAPNHFYNSPRVKFLGSLSNPGNFYSNCGLLTSGSYLLPPGLYYSEPLIPIGINGISSATIFSTHLGLQRWDTTEFSYSFLMLLVKWRNLRAFPWNIIHWGSSGPLLCIHSSIPSSSFCLLLPSSRVTQAFSTLTCVFSTIVFSRL